MSSDAKGPYRERLTDGGPYRVTKPGGKEDTYSDRDTASLACRLMNEAYAAGTADTCAEITRLRRSLNMIAWPGSFGINSDQATPEMYRHIAQDTLAIGAVGATIRLEKFVADHPLRAETPTR